MTVPAHALSPTLVDEIAATVFQTDVLASHEYFDASRRKTHIEPEKNLMFAILEDAVRCYRACAFAKSGSTRRKYLDAERWLWKNDWQWMFSYRNICEVLALNPFYIRRGLLRWKESAGNARNISVRRARGADHEIA